MEKCTLSTLALYTKKWKTVFLATLVPWKNLILVYNWFQRLCCIPSVVPHNLLCTILVRRCLGDPVLTTGWSSQFSFEWMSLFIVESVISFKKKYVSLNIYLTLLPSQKSNGDEPNPDSLTRPWYLPTWWFVVYWAVILRRVLIATCTADRLRRGRS